MVRRDARCSPSVWLRARALNRSSSRWQRSERVLYAVAPYTMTLPTRDPIAFVEACYDLSAPQQQWLQGVADTGRPLMRAMTVLAYHLDVDEGGLHVNAAAQSGEGHGDVAARILSIGRPVRSAARRQPPVGSSR